MGTIRFYRIREDYINYLHRCDNRVQLNKGERRPYVGVVFLIGEIEYFAPLESPKPNHANIKSGGPVMKLDGGELGIIGFNNMLPVNRECLILFDIAAEADPKYRYLLLNQLAFCKKNKETIFRRAKMVYGKATVDGNAFYKKVCCDFKKLEEKRESFVP